MTRTAASRIAAIFGFLAVTLGAFGAHGLKGKLELLGMMANWNTATLYHLVHAVALLALAQRENVARLPVWLFSTGIVIFSGSLYIMGVTGLKWLGAITPIGGLALLGGWLAVAFQRKS